MVTGLRSVSQAVDRLGQGVFVKSYSGDPKAEKIENLAQDPSPRAGPNPWHMMDGEFERPRTRPYISTFYIQSTLRQVRSNQLKAIGGTVFKRHTSALDPPRWYIISPPFTPFGST